MLHPAAIQSERSIIADLSFGDGIGSATGMVAPALKLFNIYYLPVVPHKAVAEVSK